MDIVKRLRSHREMVNYGNGNVQDEPDPDCEAAATLIEQLQTWQPMTTAPKDGTEILVWWPILKSDDDGNLTDQPTGEGARVVTRWQDGRGAAGEWDEPPFVEAVGEYFGDDCEYAPEPTHWMLVAEPPK